MYDWLVLSDEQMSKRWQFSLLNDEQMSNWVGVKHLPDEMKQLSLFYHTFLNLFHDVMGYKQNFQLLWRKNQEKTS